MTIVEMLRACGDCISNESADRIEELENEVRDLKAQLDAAHRVLGLGKLDCAACGGRGWARDGYGTCHPCTLCAPR